MDFLKIFRSLEEFLYEVIAWLIFYPRTVLRVVCRPLSMSDYAIAQVEAKSENPFADAISPPLFLMLSLILVHIIALATHNEVSTGRSVIGQMVMGSEQNLLIYRSIAYSLWPLIFATGVLRRTGKPIDRDTLRSPFFAQCFLSAPFVLGINLSTTLLHIESLVVQIAALCLLAASLVWYLTTQVRWIRAALGCSVTQSIALTIWQFLLGAVINLLIGICLLTL